MCHLIKIDFVGISNSTHSLTHSLYNFPLLSLWTSANSFSGGGYDSDFRINPIP